MGIEDRTRGERETLIFHSPERATDFTERVESRIEKERKVGVTKEREIVSQELAAQFESEGHGVAPLAHPWEHSASEHKEAQQLVDIAFSQDLSVAIARAEQSPSFPRNIDLFHDLLTGEMYKAVVDARVNTYHTPRWMTLLFALVIVLALGAVLMFAFSI